MSKQEAAYTSQQLMLRNGASLLQTDDTPTLDSDSERNVFNYGLSEGS